MPVNAAEYLRRLGVDEHVGAPTLALLTHLQAAHMIAVPFENLHVAHRRGVRTDLAWSFEKIVRNGRGGWCFELNGCFGALLGALGFDVTHVACRVWDSDDGEYGPDLDHLALAVQLDGSRFLVDVGFGDNCVHPILLEPAEAAGVPRRTRMELDGDAFTLNELLPTGEWQPQLAGTLVPRAMDEFRHRSEFLQHDPTSVFWQKPFATRALDATGSRVTLRSAVLRQRVGVGEFVDYDVDDPAEWAELLHQHFGLVDSRP